METHHHSGCDHGICCGNNIVQPLLTDLYQITMAYAYWKSNKINDTAVFEVFFRKNPFKGEFTIFAGLNDVLQFIERFRYSDGDINYLKATLPSTIEEEFFEYLKEVTGKDITIYAVPEGSVIFPKIPLLRVEGSLIVAQLMETTILNLVNFASLVTTNAARHKMAAGDIECIEFGLRRAQGPDGGLSASKYSYMGGFGGSSNVLAGKLYNIPVRGTHAHSYVTSFKDTTDVYNKILKPKNGGCVKDILELAINYRKQVAILVGVAETEVRKGELAAFLSYAIAFPNGFVALLDTYDVIKSGLINFCATALALNDLDYMPIGVRIDSGDLAYLSVEIKKYFDSVAKKFNRPWFSNLTIMASNDLNEETILSLNEQGHKITCFAIGTHLVTCQKQPALGCVYKLVEVNNTPRMKLSQEIGKITLPGRKNTYRLFGKNGEALLDLIQKVDENPPVVNEKVLCRHPFEESKRTYVIPSSIECLLKVYWKDGELKETLPSLNEIRENVKKSLKILRPDFKRYLNPTPYKVAVSNNLYSFLHRLWFECMPVGELS